MKKTLLVVLGCLLLSSMAAAGTPLTKAEMCNQYLSKMVGEIQSQLAFEQARYDNPALAATGQGISCVEVDLELPDTVFASGPRGWIGNAEGYFELTNCGDEAAEIWLAFEIVIVIDDIIDTAVITGDFPVWMGAGETISEEFWFPVPPFDAVYTVCVTATSGEAVDSDCETMVVVGTEFPGIPFEGCGPLLQSGDCVVFAPFGDSAGTFLLDNYGDFGPGDMVYVSGWLQWDCETDCAGVVGCITDNTIDECGGPPPGFPFEACGVLVDGPDCVLFAPQGDMYTLLQLDNLGGYGAGDTVYVVGLLDFECIPTCTDAVACLIDNTVGECPGDPEVFPIEACGLLVEAEGCLLFDLSIGGYHGDGLYELDFYGSFQAGDTVWVAGLLVPDCETECTAAVGCIIDNMIDYCQQSPPEWPVEGCGVLVQGTECVLFQMMGPVGGLFVLDFYGDFVVGDSVFVAGLLVPDCETTCIDADGCIIDNIIEPCDYDPPEIPIEACGILVEGTGCVLFEIARWFDPGNGWGESFVLENYGDFVVGDTVFVAGILDFECDPGCPEAMGCIVQNSIDTCGLEPPPDSLYVEGCGILMLGSSDCVLFLENWSGMMFLLDTYGDFQVGDEVFVAGMATLSCDVGDCIEAMGCVAVDVIDSCGGGHEPPDSMYIESCGTLVPGSSDCVLFLEEWSGMMFLLDTYGDFQVGDQVFVAGMATLSCDVGDCVEAWGCITVDVIDSCGGGNEPPDSVVISACGELIPGSDSGCVLFLVRTGGFQGVFLLSDYGGFGPGDLVCVTGLLDFECTPECGAMACIDVIEIVADGPAAVSTKTIRTSNYPNPFNPRTTISFELPQATQVTVTVHNLLGQTVKVLADRYYSAGLHEVEWNGDDAGGRRIASGVYFYRISAGEFTETKKMLLMK